MALGEIKRKRRKVQAARLLGKRQMVRFTAFEATVIRTVKGGYVSSFCPRFKGQRFAARGAKRVGARCGEGRGTTPTRAIRKAMVAAARKLK